MTDAGLTSRASEPSPSRLRRLLSDPTDGQARVVLIVLTALAVGLRLAYAATVKEADAIVGWDGWEYLSYARSILAGTSDAYVTHLNSIRPPFYPLFLAGCTLITTAVVPFVQFLQSLFGGAHVVLAYRTVRLVSCNRGALVAAALIAFCPHLVFLSAFLYTETLFALLLWAGLYFFVRAAVPLARRSVVLLVVSAALLGLAALTRPTVLLLAPVLALILLIGPRFRFELPTGTMAQRFLVFAGVFVAIVTPWMFRNLAIHGEFTLAPRHGAFILAFGNSPKLLGVYEAETVDEYYSRQNALTAQFEVEGGIPQSEWLIEPKRFVREDTTQWLRLEMHKMLHFWTPWVNPMLYSASVVALSAVYSVPVFLVGLFGLGRLLKHRPPLGRPLLAVIGIGFLTGGLIFHTQVRYRVPFVDIALALAAATVFCRRDDGAAVNAGGDAAGTESSGRVGEHG